MGEFACKDKCLAVCLHKITQLSRNIEKQTKTSPKYKIYADKQNEGKNFEEKLDLRVTWVNFIR